VTAQATSKDYDRRSEALWASLDDRDEELFRAKIEQLISSIK